VRSCCRRPEATAASRIKRHACVRQCAVGPLQSEAIGGGVSGGRRVPSSPESGAVCQPTGLMWLCTKAGAGRTNARHDTWTRHAMCATPSSQLPAGDGWPTAVRSATGLWQAADADAAAAGDDSSPVTRPSANITAMRTTPRRRNIGFASTPCHWSHLATDSALGGRLRKSVVDPRQPATGTASLSQPANVFLRSSYSVLSISPRA
jgi:hypothetical protein